jgi:hypothetical protein
MFVWNDAGTVRVSRGPLWTNDTTRSAGTALTRVNGILLNSVSITNGPAASRGTYVGTIRSNGAGSADWTLGAAASGGTAAFLSVWNAYNRVNITTNVIDSGTSYTYTSATFRQANASAGNQITLVVGLQEDGLTAAYSQRVDTVAASAADAQWGIGFDSTTTFQNYARARVHATSAVVEIGTLPAVLNMTPAIGVHVLAAVESGDNVNANTFNGNSSANLSATFRM